jgi:hypothetical protein
VARGFLSSAPEDRSGEDRTLVVVHVSAENLAKNVPAEMRAELVEAHGDGVNDVCDVPAGTSQPSEATCHVAGLGSIEAATAQKHACDSSMLGAVVDKHGKVLALGRSRRLVTKPLRRALMIRDGMCQYPGCHSTRHLKAHHRVPWIKGGRTDLDNLILLCQWHHTVVHEGEVVISRDGDAWVFTKPDGQLCQPWVSDQQLAWHLDFALRQQSRAQGDRLAEVGSFHHPDAQTIRPRWTGDPFDLHACVQALFTIKLHDQRFEQDQQAA